MSFELQAWELEHWIRQHCIHEGTTIGNLRGQSQIWPSKQKRHEIWRWLRSHVYQRGGTGLNGKPRVYRVLADGDLPRADERPLSYPVIGRLFGVDHAAVLFACREGRANADPSVEPAPVSA